MVELIGVCTMIALVWVVGGAMATESDAEKRRSIGSVKIDTPGLSSESERATRQAA